MKCYKNNINETIEVSKKLENKILSIIDKFVIYTSSSYGLEANNDGGIDDISYTREYYDLVPENFIVDEDNVIGYVYQEYVVEFDGKKEVLIYEIDNTDRSGWNNVVDVEYAKIRFKNK